MTTVLSIGNSFSQDAHRYLHTISYTQNNIVIPANLYFAGCSLEQHHRYMTADKERYNYEFKGDPTGLVVKLSDALSATPYDAVTLQQASHFSPFYDTYQPYLSELAATVRRYLPKARLYMHQTWAYETDSERLKALGFASFDEMFEQVRAAYDKAAAEIGASVIPCGLALQNALRYGLGEPIHRDTFHASTTYGRYILAATWYMTLTGKSIHNAPLFRFDNQTTPTTKKLEICNRAAADAVRAYGYRLEDDLT